MYFQWSMLTVSFMATFDAISLDMISIELGKTHQKPYSHKYFISKRRLGNCRRDTELRCVLTYIRIVNNMELLHIAVSILWNVGNYQRWSVGIHRSLGIGPAPLASLGTRNILLGLLSTASLIASIRWLWRYLPMGSKWPIDAIPSLTLQPISKT